MVSVVYEDMIIGATIHNLSATPGQSSFVPEDGSQEVVNRNIFSSIILHQLGNGENQKLYNQQFFSRKQ